LLESCWGERKSRRQIPPSTLLEKEGVWGDWSARLNQENDLCLRPSKSTLCLSFQFRSNRGICLKGQAFPFLIMSAWLETYLR
jgi:hypothetical protein